MIITADIFEAQTLPQIERFGLADGRFLVIEADGDYASADLPQEVRDIIEARNAPLGPYVPESISRTAGLLTLDDFGLSSAYTSWASDAGRTFRERVFIDAPTWRRNDPVLIAAAESLGVAGNLDAMFQYGAANYDAQG